MEVWLKAIMYGGVLYNQLKCDDILDIFWIRKWMKWGLFNSELHPFG